MSKEQHQMTPLCVCACVCVCFRRDYKIPTHWEEDSLSWRFSISLFFSSPSLLSQPMNIITTIVILIYSVTVYVYSAGRYTGFPIYRGIVTLVWNYSCHGICCIVLSCAVFYTVHT